MRAVDHYTEAERILNLAAGALAEDGPGVGTDEDIALAQVHATLALAGATAMQAYSTAQNDDLDDWAAAASDVDPGDVQITASLRESLVAIGWTPPPDETRP